MRSHTQKSPPMARCGEIVTLLTIGAFVLLGIGTLVTSFIVGNKKPTTTTSHASGSNCTRFPAIGAPDTAPAGYYWEADCDNSKGFLKNEIRSQRQYCVSSAECNQNVGNADSGFVNPNTSNFCYSHFSTDVNDQRCMLLRHAAECPQPGGCNPAATPTQPQQPTNTPVPVPTSSQQLTGVCALNGTVAPAGTSCSENYAPNCHKIGGTCDGRGTDGTHCQVNNWNQCGGSYCGSTPPTCGGGGGGGNQGGGGGQPPVTQPPVNPPVGGGGGGPAFTSCNVGTTCNRCINLKNGNSFPCGWLGVGDGAGQCMATNPNHNGPAVCSQHPTSNEWHETSCITAASYVACKPPPPSCPAGTEEYDTASKHSCELNKGSYTGTNGCYKCTINTNNPPPSCPAGTEEYDTASKHSCELNKGSYTGTNGCYKCTINTNNPPVQQQPTQLSQAAQHPGNNQSSCDISKGQFNSNAACHSICAGRYGLNCQQTNGCWTCPGQPSSNNNAAQPPPANNPPTTSSCKSLFTCLAPDDAVTLYEGPGPASQNSIPTVYSSQNTCNRKDTLYSFAVGAKSVSNTDRDVRYLCTIAPRLVNFHINIDFKGLQLPQNTSQDAQSATSPCPQGTCDYTLTSLGDHYYETKVILFFENSDNPEKILYEKTFDNGTIVNSLNNKLDLPDLVYPVTRSVKYAVRIYYQDRRFKNPDGTYAVQVLGGHLGYPTSNTANPAINLNFITNP